MPLKRTIYACALLFLAACSSAKDDTSPAPKNDLLGRWQVVSNIETYYDSAGKVISQSTTTYAPGAFKEYTETEILYYQGTFIDRQIGYTRQDSVLHMGSSLQASSYETIRKLDAHQLKLLSNRSNISTGAQRDNIAVYSR